MEKPMTAVEDGRGGQDRGDLDVEEAGQGAGGQHQEHDELDQVDDIVVDRALLDARQVEVGVDPVEHVLDAQPPGQRLGHEERRVHQPVVEGGEHQAFGGVDQDEDEEPAHRPYEPGGYGLFPVGQAQGQVDQGVGQHDAAEDDHGSQVQRGEQVPVVRDQCEGALGGHGGGIRG